MPNLSEGAVSTIGGIVTERTISKLGTDLGRQTLKNNPFSTIFLVLFGADKQSKYDFFQTTFSVLFGPDNPLKREGEKKLLFNYRQL